MNPKLIEVIDKYPDRKKLFDYGCGWGEFADLMQKKDFEVTGFDDADEMILKAKKNFVSPNFLFKKEFNRKYEKLRNTFDVVTSNLLLCILKKTEQKKMLYEIKELVKSSGLIVLSFCHPCFDYLKNSAVSKRIAEKNHKYGTEFRYKKIIHENKIEFYDYHRPLEYYTQLFNEENLQIIDIKESITISSKVFPDFIIFVLKKNYDKIL